jgi:hypothetical protein
MATIAGAMLAGAPAAQGQSPLDGAAYAFPVPDYVSTLVGTNTLDPAFTNKRGSRGHKPKRPARVKHATRAQLATLAYKPSAAVTDGVDALVLDQAGPEVDPTVLRAQLDAARTQFRDVLHRVGWHADDLGDMAAFAFLQAYVTWHSNGTVPEKGLPRLRAAVRDNLARQAPVRRLSDARQQQIAEILELRMILFLDQRNDAQVAGDSASVAIARGDVRDWARSVFGVDLNDVRLTARGLVPR